MPTSCKDSCLPCGNAEVSAPGLACACLLLQIQTAGMAPCRGQEALLSLLQHSDQSASVSRDQCSLQRCPHCSLAGQTVRPLPSWVQGQNLQVAFPAVAHLLTGLDMACITCGPGTFSCLSTGLGMPHRWPSLQLGSVKGRDLPDSARHRATGTMVLIPALLAAAC